MSIQWKSTFTRDLIDRISDIEIRRLDFLYAQQIYSILLDKAFLTSARPRVIQVLIPKKCSSPMIKIKENCLRAARHIARSEITDKKMYHHFAAVTSFFGLLRWHVSHPQTCGRRHLLTRWTRAKRRRCPRSPAGTGSLCATRSPSPQRQTPPELHLLGKGVWTIIGGIRRDEQTISINHIYTKIIGTWLD